MLPKKLGKVAGLALLTGSLLMSSSGCGKLKWVSDAIIPATEGSLPPWASSGAGSVTDVYGLATVREGTYVAESRIKPWSSWWYPAKDPYLFQATDAGPAPLQRYDSWALKAHQQKTTAAEYERTRLYDPDASAWEGLCNAWAIASLMENEPTKPVDLNGVHFRVGDLKALLIKSYERFEGLRFFGQRYNGDRKSDFSDIYPDQFHRILQEELFERGRPFIMDKDPGVPVWNTPVWKAETRILPDPADVHVMHVTTWLTGANPFITDYDYVGTVPVSFEYTYDLYGEPKPGGAFEVRSGTWTGDSVDFHPDFVTMIPDTKVRRSNNSELNPDWIDEIVRGTSTSAATGS